MALILKYFLCWFPMLLLAICNGALRDMVYKKYTGELPAHQLSTISLILLFAFYIYVVVNKIPIHSVNQAMIIGIMWLMMTLLFEFGFGRIRGNSWAKLLHDYNILEGRIWVLVPLWVLLAPLIFYKFRR